MKIWLIILGMMFVTYLPRLIPLITLSERQLPPFWRRFLLCIPFTALGALIIPGVIASVPGKPVAALTGIGTAAVCAWFKGGMILSVLASIAATFLMLNFLH
ncbi:MAG: AzlD domain-containing protein [Bacillota bacterium]